MLVLVLTVLLLPLGLDIGLRAPVVVVGVVLRGLSAGLDEDDTGLVGCDTTLDGPLVAVVGWHSWLDEDSDSDGGGGTCVCAGCTADVDFEKRTAPMSLLLLLVLAPVCVGRSGPPVLLDSGSFSSLTESIRSSLSCCGRVAADAGAGGSGGFLVAFPFLGAICKYFRIVGVSGSVNLGETRQDVSRQ